jgi:hypothetical protein
LLRILFLILHNLIRPGSYILIFIAGWIFGTVPLCSQELTSEMHGFRKGFLVKSNGDTLRGSILNPYGDGISSTLFFHHKKAQTEKYGPFEVAGFGFYKTGKIYTANEVPGSEGSGLHFVRILIDGEYDLLYYDYLGTDHFLIKNPLGKITDLSGNQPVTQAFNNGIVSDSLFNQNLRVAFADKPEILQDYGPVQMNKKSLVKLLSSYYSKNGVRYTNYYRYGKKIIPEIILGSGFSRFVPNATVKGLQSTYGPSPYLGLGLHATNMNTGTGVFLQSVIGLVSYHFNFSDIYPGGTVYNESFIKSYVSTSRAGLSVEPFKRGILSPFFEIGPMASVLISPGYENYYDVLREDSGEAFSFHDHKLLYPVIYFGGFARAGIGVNMRKLNPLRISIGYDYMLSSEDPGIDVLGVELMYRLKFR